MSGRFQAWGENGQEIPSDQFPKVYDPDDYLGGFYAPHGDLYTHPAPEPEAKPAADPPKLCVCREDFGHERDDSDGYEPAPDRPMPLGIRVGVVMALLILASGSLAALVAWLTVTAIGPQ